MASASIVTTNKYGGFHLVTDPSWDTHIEQVMRKASKRLHFLAVLARCGQPCEDLVTTYNGVSSCLAVFGSHLLLRCNKKRSQAALLETLQKKNPQDTPPICSIWTFMYQINISTVIFGY